MSPDPKIYRPEDLAALVADSVLRLINGADHHEDAVKTAIELAAALRDGETRGLADRGPQYWYWLAATEAALAFSVEADQARACHKMVAFRALRMARMSAAEVALLPVISWADADVEEFWKVGLATQALAVTWLRAPRMAPADVLDQLQRIASIAAVHSGARLAVATQHIARDLKLELPLTRKPRASSRAVRGTHPAQIARRMITDGRPDLCEPTVKRSVIAELARLGGASGPVAARLAELNEAIAVADVWPFMFGGPPSGWGPVRDDPLFDSLFYRAAAIGAGRRTGSLPWLNAQDLAAGTSTLWLRELNANFSAIVGVSYAPDAGWRSALVRLRGTARNALVRLAAGHIRALEPDDFLGLGELLLGSLFDCAALPRLLTAVLSPGLRCLPLEVLRIDGQVLADSTLVSVVPSLLAVASRTTPSLDFGNRLRVLGLFDQSLSGAVAEIEVLRDLVRRGAAGGVAFNGPTRLRHALETGTWDVLTIAAHGGIRAGVPVLEPPARPLSIPEMLEWTLPPVVNLAACRSAEPTSTAVPLDWVTVALRRGARSVIAARWAVPDRSTSRITARFYTNLAERRYQHAATAFWDAVRTERDRRPDPWFWAGLGLFGDELRPVETR